MNEKKIFMIFIVGLISGIGVNNLTSSNICPTPHCIDKARVIPVTNTDYFDAAHEIFKNAEKSIHMVSFELKYYEKYPDSKINILINDLIDAKNRGVDVKIIVDQFSKENNAFELLRENGIEIRYDSEKVTTHSKLIIVDGKIILIGSTNLSHYGLEKNNEANVKIISDNTGSYFEKYFQEFWNK